MNSEFLEDFQFAINSEEPVSPDARLADIEEWDSLSAMAFIALADRKYGRKLKFPDLEKARTVRDLHELLR